MTCVVGRRAADVTAGRRTDVSHKIVARKSSVRTASQWHARWIGRIGRSVNSRIACDCLLGSVGFKKWMSVRRGKERGKAKDI